MKSDLETFVFLALGLMLAVLTLPPVSRIIIAAGHVRPNYRGEVIPVSVGLAFFLVPFLLFMGAFALRPGAAYLDLVPAFLLATGGMAVLGLVDDVYGSRKASGLRGHLVRLLRGEITTGALKAIGGLAIAFFASLATARGPEILLNTLIIALSANALNLLDLRPGRAGKGFLAAGGVLFAVSWGSPLLVFPAAVGGALLAYLPADLRARAMMGDAGANVLGVVLGLAAVWILPLPAKVGVLIFLVGFHLFTERYSLTEVIAKNRLLDFVDRLGRTRRDSPDP